MYIRNFTQSITIQGYNFRLRDGNLPPAGPEMDIKSHRGFMKIKKIKWKEKGLEQNYNGNRRYPPLCPLFINTTLDNLLKEFIKYADIVWKLNLY